MKKEKSLYDRVSIAGINSKVWSSINGEREKPVSYNTVYLALKDETPSTPLRARIREIAKAQLQEIEAPEPVC